MISLDHRISRWFFLRQLNLNRIIKYVHPTIVEALTKKGEQNDTKIE